MHLYPARAHCMCCGCDRRHLFANLDDDGDSLSFVSTISDDSDNLIIVDNGEHKLTSSSYSTVRMATSLENVIINVPRVAYRHHHCRRQSPSQQRLRQKSIFENNNNLIQPYYLNENDRSDCVCSLSSTKNRTATTKKNQEAPRIMKKLVSSSDCCKRRRKQQQQQQQHHILSNKCQHYQQPRATNSNYTRSNSKTTSRFALQVLIIAAVQMLTASAAKLPDIYWNASNPIFRIDNTDHIFDVNKNAQMFDYDQVDIVCPQPRQQSISPNGTPTDQQQQPGGEQQSERYIIYNVSKEEYDMCRIINDSARIIAACDSKQQPSSTTASAAPNKSKYFTVTFRSFTPQPRGLEFKPGQDYYFISTLAGHLNDSDKRFSPCKEHNMKVIFKVCCKPPTPVAPSASASASASLASSASASSSSSSSTLLAAPVPTLSTSVNSLQSDLTLSSLTQSVGKHHLQTPVQQPLAVVGGGGSGNVSLFASAPSASPALHHHQHHQPSSSVITKGLMSGLLNSNNNQPLPKDPVLEGMLRTNKQPAHYQVSTMPSNQLQAGGYAKSYQPVAMQGYPAPKSNMVTIRPKYLPQASLSPATQPHAPHPVVVMDQANANYPSASANFLLQQQHQQQHAQPATVLPIEDLLTPTQTSPTLKAGPANQSPASALVTPLPAPFLRAGINGAGLDQPSGSIIMGGNSINNMRDQQQPTTNQRQPVVVEEFAPGTLVELDPRYRPTPIPPDWRNGAGRLYPSTSRNGQLHHRPSYNSPPTTEYNPWQQQQSNQHSRLAVTQHQLQQQYPSHNRHNNNNNNNNNNMDSNSLHHISNNKEQQSTYVNSYATSCNFARQFSFVVTCLLPCLTLSCLGPMVASLYMSSKMMLPNSG